MFDITTIEQLIKKHVNLKHNMQDVWHNVRCPICNDYKIRAGFKFSNNGEDCTYHCFNHSTCGGSYNPKETSGFMSNNFKNVLKYFNVNENDIKELIYNNNLLYNSTSKTKEQVKTVKRPLSIQLPQYFKKISEHTGHEFATECSHYLKNRCIDVNQYPFYFTDKTPFDIWDYRLIIPCFYKDDIVHYIGRDVLDIHKKRFIKANTPIENVLYNFNEIFRQTNECLLMFEGFMDGFCLNPLNFVSIDSSSFTKGQINWLNVCKRRKILVPDYDENGFELIQQAINNGFEVSFPNIKNCKDINECVIKFGKLYVLEQIFSNIYKGDDALIRLNLLKFG